MTYAISNTEGGHLGFILLSGGPDSGDCVVRSLPLDSEDFDSAETDFLYKLQMLGELQWERIDDEFHISGPDGEAVLVERGGIMRGSGFIFVVEAVS